MSKSYLCTFRLVQALISTLCNQLCQSHSTHKRCMFVCHHKMSNWNTEQSINAEFFFYVFLNRAVLYNYIIRTNKMHTFHINVLIQLWCLRHLSNIQLFNLRKTCTCSLIVFLSCIHISSPVNGRIEYRAHPSIDRTAYVDA